MNSCCATTVKEKTRTKKKELLNYNMGEIEEVEVEDAEIREAEGDDAEGGDT